MLIMTIEWEAGLKVALDQKRLQSAICEQITHAQWSFRKQITSIEERKNKIVVTFQLMKQDVELVEQALRKVIGNSVMIDGESCPIRLYVGSYFNDQAAYDELDIAKSLYALQIAKRKGVKRNYMILSEQVDQYHREILLEATLFDGLQYNQFRLDFQPIYRLDNGELVGFEALVRWLHPQFGLISPLEFIPLAEQSGMIVELGEWIIAEACQQLKRIQHILSDSELHISINVSPVQLKLGNIVDVVSKQAAHYQIARNHIQFELTESTMELVDEQVIAEVQALQEAGFLIAIDDFGTGYACLESLSSMPVSCVKLDKQFIHKMESSKSYYTVVKHTISMLKELDVELIAEGIETSEQYSLISQLGCNFAQGYYMSRPIPVAQLEEMRLAELAVHTHL